MSAAMLRTRSRRQVQTAVIVLAAILACLVWVNRDDGSLALVVTQLAGLVAGTLFALWMLAREAK